MDCGIAVRVVAVSSSPEEMAKIRQKVQPIIDRYSKEVGESMMKQVNVEFDKMVVVRSSANR